MLLKVMHSLNFAGSSVPIEARIEIAVYTIHNLRLLYQKHQESLLITRDDLV